MDFCEEDFAEVAAFRLDNASSGFDYVTLDGEAYRLGPVRNVESHERVAELLLDGYQRHADLVGDILVREPVRGELEHLQRPFSKLWRDASSTRAWISLDSTFSPGIVGDRPSTRKG